MGGTRAAFNELRISEYTVISLIRGSLCFVLLLFMFYGKYYIFHVFIHLYFIIFQWFLTLMNNHGAIQPMGFNEYFE